VLLAALAKTKTRDEGAINRAEHFNRSAASLTSDLRERLTAAKQLLTGTEGAYYKH
jgi:hypothetical protein